jgi:hypothetical protein
VTFAERSLFDASKLDSDPKQQELVRLFIEEGDGQIPSIRISHFLVQQQWRAPEESNRIVHALSIVEVSRPDIYPRAKETAKMFCMNL